MVTTEQRVTGGVPRPNSDPPPTDALRRRWRPSLSLYDWVVGVVAVILVFFVLYPLILTFLRTFHPKGAWDFTAVGTAVSAPWFSTALWDTMSAVGSAGLLAAVVATTIAWLNERTNANFGLVGEILPLLPLLVPPIAMTIGWSLLGLPKVGFINVALGKAELGAVNIQSWIGLVWVYALYFVPYIYIIVAAALRNLDPALEEASRTSGASIWRTLHKVTLPAIRPALLSSLVLVVIIGLSQYSIPRIIAPNADLDILSVRIIRMLTTDYPPRTGEAVVVSGVLFVVILVAWLLQRRATRAGTHATIGGRGRRLDRWQLPTPMKWFSRGLMLGYIFCASLLPVAAILIVSLQPFWRPKIDVGTFTLDHFHEVFDDHVAMSSIKNSLTFGATAGLLGVIVATVVALYVQQRRSSWTTVVDTTSKVPAALSNVVIGVGFLFAFSGAPFHLSGTLLILFLCYLVIHMPQASIAADAAASQVGRELSEASYVSGAGQGRTLRKVMVPLMLPGLVGAWALLFVMIAGELAASSLLAGVGKPVIGFVLVGIWDNGDYGKLAAFAAIVTCLAAVVVTTAFVVGRRLQRHSRH